jgi:hypothetical protein
MKRITPIVLALLVAVFLSSCSDKEDDAETYKGWQDPKIVGKDAAKKTNTRYHDVAGNGILWKPVAESGGKLVVLLNRSYGKPPVAIKDRRNRVIATGNFVYFSNPDRATYRFSLSGPQIQNEYGSVYLIVGNRIFFVPTPSRRYE